MSILFMVFTGGYGGVSVLARNEGESLMIFKKEFLNAIDAVLSGQRHYLVGNNFYIYRPEVEMVCEFSFYVLCGGRDFEILGGAAAFCDDIEILPETCASKENRGRLNVWCPSVGDYARAQGLADIQNTNFDAMGIPQKYTKEELLPKLWENTALLKDTLLAELLSIKSMDDYYAFALKRDSLFTGTKYFPQILFPSLGAFFLSIRVGKMQEASAIYIVLLRQQSEAISKINACMRFESAKELTERFAQIDYPNTMRGAVERWMSEIKIVDDLLEERRELLMEEVSRRIEKSKKSM